MDKIVRLTEEQWLRMAARELAPKFKAAQAELPDVQINTSFPGGSRGGKKRIGEYWSISPEREIGVVFVSPRLATGVEALATLAHELIHASDDGASGHRGHFARVAKEIGFVGPMQNPTPSPELTLLFEEIEEYLGVWSELHIAVDPGTNPKADTNRNLKAECPSCGWKLNTSMTRIMQGLPFCGAHGDEPGPRLRADLKRKEDME